MGVVVILSGCGDEGSRRAGMVQTLTGFVPGIGRKAVEEPHCGWQRRAWSTGEGLDCRLGQRFFHKPAAFRRSHCRNTLQVATELPQEVVIEDLMLAKEMDKMLLGVVPGSGPSGSQNVDAAVLAIFVGVIDTAAALCLISQK